jgi:hypothetical protein
MKRIIAKCRGWRTIIIAGALGLAPLWDAALQIIPVLATDPDLPTLIPESWRPAYAVAVTLVMIWMRAITSTGLGQREAGE